MALAAASVQGVDDAALRQLVEQGRFWDARQQPERSIQAWERVLGADAKNTEALSRLALLHARAGNATRSQKYLDQLAAAAPGSALLTQTRQSLTAGRLESGGGLERARSLAASKDTAGAIAAYEQAFGGKPPDGPLAVEYYQVLGASEAGWAAAREGLAQQASRYPADARTQLVYAQHLSYRENTRREGIDRLADLAQGGNAEASKAWRQALVWLQPRPGDEGRYQRYFQAKGEDPELRNRLQGLQAAAQARTAAARGAEYREMYAQIERGELAEAERSIEARLRESPRNADALGALGVLRLRQGRYEESEKALQQAQAASPGSEGRFASALRSASFWRRIQKAQAAQEAGDLSGAEADYRAALARPPESIPDSIRTAHADVLIEQGKDNVAEPMLRDVLKRSPDNADALRGLITVLGRTGRGAEALKLADRAPASMQDQLAGLRADQLRTRAGAARSAGDLPRAQADLEQALLLAPASPWVRLDLAAVYRSQGRTAQAETLLDGLAQTHGDLPEVQMAQAYAAGERGEWQQVLQMLEQLPAAQRTGDARQLQRRAWVQYQVQRAAALRAARRPAEAYGVIEQASQAAGEDGELRAAVAGAWAEAGDTARAVADMRMAIQRNPQAAPALRIQYAGLLLSSGQDAEFEVASDDLATRAVLTAAQQRELDDLITGYRVKLADRSRMSGNLAEAYVQLRDVVARYPQDERVQMALARLLTSSGDTEQASQIYQSLMARKNAGEDARLGLIDTYLAAGNPEAVRSLVRSGVRANPKDARYWLASARLAESEGRRGDALADYRRAEILKGNAQQAQESGPPQLAWLDPTQPDRALPPPVADALTSVAASTGPLRPRAAAVALPPGRARSLPAPSSQPATAEPGLRLAQNLGQGEASGWLPPPARPPLRLRSDAQLSDEGTDGDFFGLFAAPSRIASTDIERLESQTSGWIGGAFTSRSRGGQAGLSQLGDIEMPLSWRSSETRAGRFGLDVTPVYLDAGAASGTDKLAYGTLALINGDADIPTHNAGGVAVGLSYNYGALTADIGTSPLGFEEERVLGGIKLSAAPGNWRLGLDVARRAVTESLLSYAGAKDPLLGRTWGGVSRTGGRGDLGYDVGSYGLYANAGFYSLDGHNVQSNNESTLGAGFYRRALRDPGFGLTFGINLTVLSYESNLRYFTFGHGGYFSPKLFTALAVPVELSGVRGAFSYRINGAVGLQSFREDGNALYPGFPGLQEELQRIADLEPDNTLVLGYAAQRNSGLGYAMGAAGEYRLMPRLAMGGKFGIDNARDYRELQLNAYLRYYFEDQIQLPAPPTPILPIYGQ